MYAISEGTPAKKGHQQQHQQQKGDSQHQGNKQHHDLGTTTATKARQHQLDSSSKYTTKITDAHSRKAPAPAGMSWQRKGSQ
jgi:hypothetical protein